jgi:hypothetical protein
MPNNKAYVRGIRRAVAYYDQHPDEFVRGFDSKIPLYIVNNPLWLAIFLDGERRGRTYSMSECQKVESLLPVEVQLVGYFTSYMQLAGWKFPPTEWYVVKPKLIEYLAALERM